MKRNTQSDKYIGRELGGRYLVEEYVGSGGMADVFRARDLQTGKDVALKILHEEIAGDSEALRRITNEAQAVRRLSHPNIIGIYDVSVKGPVKYLVMEYVEGISLRDYMDRRGALPYGEVLKFGEQILAALEHAHSKGVIHRDIKPQNIMLLKNGIVKVTDFDIAKISDAETSTIADAAIGTVYYISPEQASRGESDARSDLYSLGIMMYEMATGRLPFYHEKAATVLMMHIKEKPVPPRVYNKKIPRGLEDIILCAIEKDPKKRYASALDMFREMRRVEKNRRAEALSPAQIRRNKRSAKNREGYRPSSSFTPVVLGIAFALLMVAVVSVFVVLDRLNITTLGSESLTVPDVVGKYYLSAEEAGSPSAYNAQLKELGLVKTNYVLSVEYVYSDGTHPAGTIISQEPSPGSHRKSPCRVTIKVSLGIEQKKVRDCTLKDYRVARSELRSDGFEISVVFEYNPIVPNGNVISTDPSAGAVVDSGSTVVITVSRGIGTAKTAMPDVVGRSEAEAKFILDQKQLLVGDVTYTRSPLPVGTVLWQSVEADTTVYSGVSVIDFYVSGGSEYDVNFYPDVRGTDIEKAASFLESLGYTVKKVPVLSYSEKNSVLSQEPVGGTPVPGLSSVTLRYSAGETFKRTLKININAVGMTVENAKIFFDYDIEKQCAENGLSVTVRYYETVTRSTAEPGRIIATSPSYGREADVASGNLSILMVVSGGKYYVPPVVGLEESEACEALESEGYAVRVEYVRDDEEESYGYVVDRSEPYLGAGPEGEDLIVIKVSLGPDYEPPETEPEITTVAEPEVTTVAQPEVTTSQEPETTAAPETGTEPEETAAVPESGTQPGV
ncbi:MAG: PASTA domain-containing protein [Clostridia bacterium]|nr:PASTA domain-containing protein [Clostridia bacterium]